MSGLPCEPLRFLLFSIICLLVCFAAEGMGLFVGAIFNVTVIIIFKQLSSTISENKHKRLNVYIEKQNEYQRY